MDIVKNIILSTSEEALEKVLSPFIREQFPAFMRQDYSKLILVVKAYYEWMDQQQNVGGVISRLDTVYDLDANADQFYEHFKNTYLVSFPEMFAQNTSGYKPNKKTLLKKIREFYGSKGTESAYKFLFKILYDSDVEFYYPKTDVIKVSDGQWIEPKSVKTTLNNGDALFAAKGGRVTQVRDEQTTGSAFVDSVVQYTLNGLPVCEFFLSDIVGDFVPELSLIITKPDGGELKELVYSVLGQFFVELPGKGYRVGDTVSVIETVGGTGFSAKVEQVGLAGSIKKLAITNSGVNYSADVLLNIFNEQGNRSARVIALRGAVTNYPGYFSGNRGKVSSNKKIFDGHYYQDFSYELKSVISFNTYFTVLKKLVHPAGMRMFGSILLKDQIDNLISSSTQASSSKTPVIGKYTPYTPRTYNNLRNGIFLPNQVRGVTLQVWLSTYNVYENTAVGVSADRTGLGESADLALGVNRWVDMSRGICFSVPQGNTPTSDVWSVPRLQELSVNTHPSLIIRPVNDSGSDLGGNGSANWVSYGYWSGITVGAMRLDTDHSYFVVAKTRKVLPLNPVGSPVGSSHLVSDSGTYHGIMVGSTDSTGNPKVLAYNRGVNNSQQVVGNLSGVGEWFMVCTTQGKIPNVNGTLTLYVNGVCAGAVFPTSKQTLIRGTTLCIGMKDASLSTVFDGEIAEVLCYQGEIGKTDREKIEGYLCHKYGLSSKLPSTHPYRNVVPGGSYSSGKWYGTTGDYYPLGYNSYIGSTTEVGLDGTTASLGSLFFDSGLGYTFTVVDEHGVTAHNPTGSPLGSTAAWKKESTLDPSHIRGLALWLKPENIGVCGSVANGRSADVWRDASPFQNHALPPTWGRFNGSGYASAGVTIDKLRPVLSVGSLAGPTGVCFNGGVIYAPTTVWNGASLAQWIQMGNTHGAGTTAERILTGQHLYLTNPLNLPDETDIFVVMRPTVDGYDKGLGLFSSDAGLTSHRRDDTVLYHRSYNPVDRNTALANSTYYRVLPNGSLLYPSVAPTGLVGFRPSGSKTGVQQNTIAYDPHVSGVCFGVAVGEWRRDSSRKIESFLNGDASKNYSLSSGRRIAATNIPNADDYLIKNGLVLWFDAGNTVSYPGSGNTWFDLSGQGNHGTLVGGVQYSNENSGAFVFDGINDHVTFLNPLNQTQLQQVWTVQSWINITTKPAQRFLGGLNAGLWVEYSQGNNSLLYLNSGTNDYYTYGGQFTAQGWVLCTFRFNNSTADRQIWRNLTNISTSGPNLTTTPSGQSSTFVLGASDASTIKGRVSNLMIYNRYLSDEEIQQNFNILRNRYGV